MYLEEYDYVPIDVVRRIQSETDREFDPILWRDDPDMDLEARAMRDQELMLAWTGNLDAPL